MIKYAIYCIFLTLLLGCSTTTYFSDEAFKNDYANLQKTWLQPPATQWKYSPDARKLGPKEYFDISDNLLGEALRLLKSSNFVELSDSDARNLVGYYYKNADSKRVFLVRALCGHKGTGGFTVLQKSGELYIEHSSLGSRSVVCKSALVVLLSEPPKNISGDISIAE